MHEGCSGNFDSGKDIVDKIRAMGFNIQNMPMAIDIKCENCEETFVMEQFEGKCPNCDMVYGVTPCHAFDAANVKPAGLDY